MALPRPIRIGLMGFGQIGRQLYRLATQSSDLELVAVADIGKLDILHYLLCSEVDTPDQFLLQGNFLICGDHRTRMMSMDLPSEVPWDLFDVDVVIDATGKYGEARFIEQHLKNGAPRVIIRTLPVDDIDRLVLPGINQGGIQRSDRMVSAGSATTTALALMLHALSAQYEFECVSVTTVHSYTSDQALQDYAGSDFRRSRSAPENIIPNSHEAAHWMGKVFPELSGKVMSAALNVPIQRGCLLDTNLVIADSAVTVADVNEVMIAAAQSHPALIGVAEDPIVSSDVIGSDLSVLFDLRGTIKAGNNIIKALGWYETLGHAARLLDVARLYADLDRREEAA